MLLSQRSMRSSVVAAALLFVAPVYAQSGPASRFVQAPVSSAPFAFKPALTPLGVSKRMVTVVLQLEGDPVAAVSAAAEVPLSRELKNELGAQLRARQTLVEQELRARGGRVLASYQHAYNGVKVQIAAEKARGLASIPGVVAVRPLQTFKRLNTVGVPLIGGPAAWGGSPAVHGEGVKIAIIDSGIDYTHADFGGPGTPAAYTTAHANEKSPADPALFGPAAAKVKGGIDLVGDEYDPTLPNLADGTPDPRTVPHPDPNPLDCDGHGSHVAGTAAGFGVLASGAVYTGPYNANTISANQWSVGPGVAPKADLYAVRVFGCGGPSDVVTEAIEWAVANDMDVINMSLGSDLGSADDPTAVAASNAAKAGVIVVVASGNAGPAPYITSSPASGTGAISVAASDARTLLAGARLALATGAIVQALNANGAVFIDGTTLPVKVLRSASGLISLGCDPAEYTAAGVVGMLVVVQRGTCARVARAIYGQKAGAAAVLMVNNVDAMPPFEGTITSNPDTGEAYTVTIPFLGVPSSTGGTLLAADGRTTALAANTFANPDYLALASFSSGGPRSGDSALKPEVTAPGVSIASAGIGTGNGPAVISGTSMATPHTAGAAALTRQAHQDWRRVRYWKAALVNTAAPQLVAGYATRNAGAGLVQVQSAAATQVVALAQRDEPVLNFGFAELDRDLTARAAIRLKNFGERTATFDVAITRAAGSPHSLRVQSSRVTVPARADVELNAELTVPAATAGDSSAFNDVAGMVTFTPVGSSNNGVTLNLPYYLAPLAVSHISTRLDTRRLRATGMATATVTNRGGAIAGIADWYAWGLADKRDPGQTSSDLRAVGVQSFPDDGVLAFAISTTRRWSNASSNEFDIFVDVDGDGDWDYDVVAIDFGAITSGVFDGRVAVVVFTANSDLATIAFLADAPFNSTSMVLPVLFDQLCSSAPKCLSPGNARAGRFTYWAQSFSLTDDATDSIEGTATFNPFNPSLSTGMFDTVAPNSSITETVTINQPEFQVTPALGFMVISHDNPSRARQGENGEAQLIGITDD